MSTATQATKKNHKKAAQQIVIMIDNINSIIDATTKALGSVSKRQQVLILTGLLVEIKANKLILTGSDAATTSRVCSEGIRSSSDCSFVVPAKLFSDVLKKLPSGKAKIIYTGKAIEILAEKARFHLNVLDASEYPQSVVKPLDKKVRINSQELARTLAAVVYAASTQESRPILTGISLNCEDERMTFIATDSHRLSKKEIYVESSDTFQNIVIPAAACQEIIRLLSLLKEDEVDLEVSHNMIRIVADNVTYSSTLLDGTYPDTSRIIPPAFKHEFNVNRVELEKAIERVNIFKESSVCTISVKDGDMPSLSISSHLTEVGKYAEELFIKKLEGGTMEVSLNSKYLLDALKGLDCNEITVKSNSSMEPLILVPDGREDQIAMILPIRRY